MSATHPFPQSGQLAPILVGTYLTLCVVLGGATQPGGMADVLLTLLGLPLVVFGAGRLATHRPLGTARSLLLIWLTLTVGVVAMSLVPLPPSIWTQLGGRDTITAALSASGVSPDWRPISLDPDATWRSLFAWIPPIAIGASATTLHRRQFARLLQWLLLLTLASAVLGLLQLTEGPDSALRWHIFTNTQDAVGPFANRNHLATLIGVGLPLAAAQILHATHPHHPSHHRVVAILVGVVVGTLLLLAIAMTRSRAGVMLGALAAIGSAIMLYRRHPEAHWSGSGKRWLGFAAIGGLMLAIQFGFWGLLQRFEADPLDDQRWAMTHITLDAADTYGAFGVGAGGFVAAYQSVEPPSERQHFLINRAHNDWAEWWLEGGVPLAVLIIGGVVCLIGLTGAAWRHRDPFAQWQRASAIALWLILLHSLVDYPLRTSAMTAVFALLAATLTAARPQRPHD